MQNAECGMGKANTRGCVTAARKKNPEIIKHLEAENAYTEAFMGPHKKFVDDLYKEMLGRIKQTDLSVPYKLRPRAEYIGKRDQKYVPIGEK